MQALTATDLLKLQSTRLRDYYNNLCIGYDGAPDCRFFVGPGPYTLTTDIIQRIIAQGEIIRQWLIITVSLLNRAYADPTLAWLAEAVEGDIDQNTVRYHQLAHQRNLVNIPVLCRPDMSSLDKVVEVQIPGSGWGYQTAIHNGIAGGSRWLGPILGYQEAIRIMAGNPLAKSAYILYNPPFYREVEYFCQQCQRAGVDLQMFYQQIPDPDEFKFIRRPPLEDLISYPDGARIVEKNLDGKIAMEPGPSLLFDQKIATAFPFHPQLQSFYPDGVRELFPETYLVRKDIVPTFHNAQIEWGQFAEISRGNRQFILKFGGARKGLRAGGKAVYNLADCNQDEVRTLIAHALEDWEKYRRPWLIQERVRDKYPIMFYDHQANELVQRPYYAVFRPAILFRPEQTEIIAFTGLFRKEWKVHGSSDSVMLPVEPK